MEIVQLIEPDRVSLGLEVADKSELLSVMAGKASYYSGIAADTILQALTKRESFGSTGVGRGIAIPHTAIKGLKSPLGFFVGLARPIDFESVDGEPVDLVFLLLTPPSSVNENVAALAAISRRLRDAEILKVLRTSKTAQEAFRWLTGV